VSVDDEVGRVLAIHAIRVHPVATPVAIMMNGLLASPGRAEIAPAIVPFVSSSNARPVLRLLERVHRSLADGVPPGIDRQPQIAPPPLVELVDWPVPYVGFFAMIWVSRAYSPPAFADGFRAPPANSSLYRTRVGRLCKEQRRGFVAQPFVGLVGGEPGQPSAHHQHIGPRHAVGVGRPIALVVIGCHGVG
jgi:hypothetical protein